MNKASIIGFMTPWIVGVFITAAPAQLVDREPAEANDVKRIAIIANYFAARSHGNAIGTHFFIGFPLDGKRIEPQVKVASLWIDQSAPHEIDYGTRGHWDVGERLAERHGATVYPTIAEALTLGGDELAVDGVLYIGEHGDYPRSRLGVKMYPRLNHLEQIFRVFDASGRSVPVFCDKHLAYSWLDSKWIYDRARELNVPMMAGSSLPVTWREPPLEHPLGTSIEEAVAVGYGAFDSYGFHVLEILQCMIERRQGGETGVASVQALRGKAVYEAADAGRFSLDLAKAACAAISSTRGDPANLRDEVPDPIAVLIAYRDGTRGTILMLGRFVGGGWGYAAKVDGRHVATEFELHSRTTGRHNLPISALPYFGALGLNIQRMFLTGKPRYPVERTLLTSGILDMAFRSLDQNGKTIETPFLDITYSVEGYDPLRVGTPRPEYQTTETWPPEGYEFLLWRRELIEQ